MIRAVLVVALVATSGCGDKEEMNDFKYAFRTMKKFRDEACKCKDQACAEDVISRMTAWDQDVNKKTAKRPEPTSTQRKEMAVVTEDLGKCLSKLMVPSAMIPTTPNDATAPNDAAAPNDAPAASPVDAPPASPPTDAPAPRSKFPEVVPAPVTTEALLASVRIWALGEHDQLRIAEVNVRYVGADGALDPESGHVTIELGRAPPLADDPKRRTGAPIKQSPDRPTKCPSFDWTPAEGWHGGYSLTCKEPELPFPRCSVETIWKRAIALGAPADAVARLYLREGKPRRWAFTITDEPRGVKISHRIDDDCEVAVEKP